MVDTPKDGGPAFPLSTPTEFQFANEGMTVRQYAAVKCMAALIYWDGPDNFDGLAKDAVAAADALIAELGKKRS